MNLQAWHPRDKSEWSEDPEGSESLCIETLQLGGGQVRSVKVRQCESLGIRTFQLGKLFSFGKTCIVDKKMSMKPIITMVKSRKFHVF